MNLMNSVTTLVMLLCLSALFMAGAALSQSDIEDNVTYDIYNLTEKTMNWTKIINRTDTRFTRNNSEYPHFSNIVIYTVDYIGKTTLELGAWVVEEGYAHPKYYREDWILRFTRVLMYWVLFAVTFPILIPLLALIYLIGKGLYWGYKKIKWRLENGK